MQKASTEQAVAQYFINELHGIWKPHTGQIPLGRALFVDNKIGAFGCFGRKAGKSTFGMYAPIRRAGVVPYTPCYIILPWAKQAREIYWASKRLERMIPRKFVKKVYQNEMRIILYNDSFVKLDGADNPELHRGPDMGFVTLDEMKDHHPDCWPGIRPNLLSVGGQFLAIGTPPDNDTEPKARQFFELEDECKQRPDMHWSNIPTSANPHNQFPEGELERIRDRLIANGQEDVWWREYMGIYVKGVERYIFPMLDRDAPNIFPDEVLTEELGWNRGQLEWHCVADPGSTFAYLFIGYNRYTGCIYFLRELYETDQSQISVLPMYQQEKQKIQELYPYPEEWLYTYDEAALWFWNERASLRIDHGWTPTHKQSMKTEAGELKPGINLLKDAMRQGKVKISREGCPEFIKELQGYKKDSNGKIPKERDHLIDTARYFLFRSGYSLIPDMPVQTKTSGPARPYTMTIQDPPQQKDVAYVRDEYYENPELTMYDGDTDGWLY